MPNHAYREAPTVRPRPFGLFSVAAPEQKSDGGWQGGEMWESIACGLGVSYANALCANPTGTNEVQTVSITGVPTGGTYTLSVYSETTTPITYNSNATTVQNALLALSAFDTGDVVVTGTYPNFTLTYGGQYLAENVPQVTATASLTGGTAPGVTTATTTAGVTTAKVSSAPAGTKYAEPFGVYILRECRSVGDINRAKDWATKMLTLAEERGVEAELWARMNAATPTNITGATDLAPEISLAQLEENIAGRYDGAAVIHVSTDLGSYLGTKGAIERHGNHMETVIGNWVVIGAGYPRTGPGGVPAAGDEWMFATGNLFVDRSNAEVRGPFLAESPRDNTQVVLAERVYVVGWDCTPSAIRVAFP
jgi:hypothetical protein